MTIEEIKVEVANIDWRFALVPTAHSHRQARRWMSWAHAQARARLSDYLHEYLRYRDSDAWMEKHGKRYGWSDTDWLAEVLVEIGWPNE